MPITEKLKTRWTVANLYRDGYVQQFNLNLQHQIGSNLVVQAGYVGRLARKLTLVREINALEASIKQLSDDALRAKTPEFRTRIEQGESLDDLRAGRVVGRIVLAAS